MLGGGSRRLCLASASLGRGGTERAVANLAAAWSGRGCQVMLITLDGAPSAHPLPAAVIWRPLHLERQSSHPLAAIHLNLRRLRRIRRLWREFSPDVVVSFGDRVNVLCLLAARGLHVPVVVSERSDPASWPIGRGWSRLRQLTYPWADRVIFQTAAAAARLPLRLRRPPAVIANPVFPFRANGPSGSALPRPLAVAMGRLDPCKGFDLLLQSFALCTAAADWRLWILGEGPARADLEALSCRLGLQARVSFPGWQPDPGAILRQADLFVLSSRFEGFPNALCEAMAAGIAAVAYDCPCGPAEIIRHGVDGYLVPPGSVQGLADAMHSLMESEARRRAFGARAGEIAQRLHPDVILQQWERIFGWAAAGDPLLTPASAPRATLG